MKRLKKTSRETKQRVEFFHYSDFSLRFNPPLTLKIFEVENGALLAARDKGLGIDVFAENSSDLLDEVKEDVKYLWLNFVEESNETLSASAVKLKRALLKRIEKKEHKKEAACSYNKEIETLRDVILFINGKESK